WGQPSVEDETARDDALEELLDLHLYRAILGTSEDADDVDDDEVAIQDPQQAGLTELPTGTLAVADLRDAPRDPGFDVIAAGLPGAPLDWPLAWREAGLVCCLVGGCRSRGDVAARSPSGGESGSLAAPVWRRWQFAGPLRSVGGP